MDMQMPNRHLRPGREALMNEWSSDRLLDHSRRLQIDANPEQAARYEAAERFLKEYARARDIGNVLDGTNFAHDVEVITLRPGDILVRYETPGQSAEVFPSGGFFTIPGTRREECGLTDCGVTNDDGRRPEFFVVTREIQALKSIARHIGAPTDNGFNDAGLLYSGGSEQIYISAADRQSGALERLVHNYLPSGREPIPTERGPTNASAELPTSLTDSAAPSLDSIMRAEAGKTDRSKDVAVAPSDILHTRGP